MTLARRRSFISPRGAARSRRRKCALWSSTLGARRYCPRSRASSIQFAIRALVRPHSSNVRFWRNCRVPPASAIWCTPTVHRTNCEGALRVDLTCSPTRRRMAAICAHRPKTGVETLSSHCRSRGFGNGVVEAGVTNVGRPRSQLSFPAPPQSRAFPASARNRRAPARGRRGLP
jgi:hypothetical protein